MKRETPGDDDAFIRTQVLPRFGLPAVGGAAARVTVTPVEGGLINRTFLVRLPAAPAAFELPSTSDPGPPTAFVLQHVNPLFHRAIHQNIAAVTAALARARVLSPHLVPTVEGLPCLELPARAEGQGATVWRLMNHIAGISFDVVQDPRQAAAAGAMVARFHRALDGLAHAFVGRRAGVHDTARHLEALERAVAAHGSHRLFAAVRALAEDISSARRALPELPRLPERICHGDLKFNNLLFAGPLPPESAQALCLVDLDTVGPMALAYELGDAWRSWCNRSGEDRPDAELDLEVLAASWEGYRGAAGRELPAGERAALLLGPEWISLELAARFAADALTETYFGWNPGRFPTRGEHNLVRALGQLSLHRAFRATRRDRAALLEVAAPK